MSFGFFNSNKGKGKPLPYIGFKTKNQIKEAEYSTKKLDHDIELIQKHLLADEKELKELEEIYIKGFHELEHMHEALKNINLYIEKLKDIELKLRLLYSELIYKCDRNETSGISLLNEQILKLNNNADQIISRIMPTLDHLILRPSHNMYRDDKKRDSLHDIDKKARDIRDYVSSLNKNLRELKNNAHESKNKFNKIGFR
jgi:chromosome segregation ATPase